MLALSTEHQVRWRLERHRNLRIPLRHEHRVGADVNDSALLVQALYEGLNLWINQRLPAADRDHGGVAFLRSREAILKGQKIFQRSGIFANPAAPGARKITGMQRFELQHGGKFFRPTKLLADNIGGDLRRERERESHKCGILTSRLRLSMEPTAASDPAIRLSANDLLTLWR